jgi:hypothetical protein
MMLATISGQALAGTAAPKAQYWRAATDRSDDQAVRAFNAIDRPMVTQAMSPMRTVITADRNTTIDRTTLNGSERLPV